jgi:hypothetical protein
MATSEEEVRRALLEAKKGAPSTKKYVAILVVAVLVLAVYFLFFSQLGALYGAGTSSITSPTAAQSTQSSLGHGTRELSSELTAISGILGG